MQHRYVPNFTFVCLMRPRVRSVRCWMVDQVEYLDRTIPDGLALEHLSVVYGNPDRDFVSTSIVERNNLNRRMNMRRFTRLTNGFSKKRENLEAAVALHFARYNLVRRHGSLRMGLMAN